MSDSHNPTNLLEELDRRQDEVLARLEQLNSEIEAILTDCQRAMRAEMETVGFPLQ